MAETWSEVRDELLASDSLSPGHLHSVEGPGIYAWWDKEGALSTFWPDGFPAVDCSRPLYVGIAKTSLRIRGAEMHMKSTRMSTLRRSLTALLHTELGLLPGAVADPRQRTKYRLSPPNELRLTLWIENHLSVTWVEVARPGEIERSVVVDLLPPLNDEFVHSGPYWLRMRLARDRVIAILRG